MSSGIVLTDVSPPYCVACPLRGLRYSLRMGQCPVFQVKIEMKAVWSIFRHEKYTNELS